MRLSVLAVVAEGDLLLASIPKGVRSIALDQTGCQWNTQQLAEQLYRAFTLINNHRV